MILIVSHAADDHASAVLDALARGGHEAVLLDTASFPAGAAISLHYHGTTRRQVFDIDGSRVDLTKVGAAWWRRPQGYTLADGLAPEIAAFSYAECHEAMSGLWHALGATWINPPDRDDVAHHKPYQLAVAADVGLPIPRTLITSDPNDARAFIAELGPIRTIYKTFLASEQCWRETRVVRPNEWAMLDLVRLAPVIFQEFVPAQADIRLTVMGERIFATAITAAPGGYDIDYRMDMAGADFQPTELPDEIVAAIRRLMARLGLVYGAIDLRRKPDGSYVFLEINPAGEWRFVEDRTAQPMTAAFAELLVARDRL